MSATCLSVAPNLRCQLLTQPQIFLVLIPPVLEIIFCISLCVIKRGSDRKHFLLAGEGLLYFVLALLDALAHLTRAVNTSLQVFKGFDISIGILTAGPLLMFTVYLVILSSQEFLPTFPVRLQRVTKWTLLLFIPIILLLNALGSFFSLEYTVIHQPKGLVPFLEWKYADSQAETFINTLTLVIYLAFQVLTFVACFLRLMKAFLDQRRIDGTANGNDHEVVLFNGLGWNAGGIKLGAIETVIGFIGGSFCMIFTRRMLRFVSRACLIIGAVKGMDIVEDFSIFNKRRTRRISRGVRSTVFSALLSPRPSLAIRPLSEFSDLKAKHQSNVTDTMSIAALVIQQPATPAPAMFPLMQPLRPAVSLDSHLIQIYKPGKHVIVKYGHGRAPTLDLRRFSELVVPLPTAPTQSLEKVTVRPTTPTSETTVPPYSPTCPIPDAKSLRAYSLPPAKSERLPLSMLSTTATRGRLSIHTSALLEGMDNGDIHVSATTISRQSQKSFASSLAGVQAIAKEFPSVPPPWRHIMSPPTSSATFSNSGAAANASDLRASRGRSTSADSGVVRRGSSVRRKPVPTLEDLEQGQMDASLSYTQIQPNLRPHLPGPLSKPNTSLAFASPPPSRRHSRRSKAHSHTGTSQSQSPRSSRVSRATVECPWMPRSGDIVQEGQAELDLAWQRLGRAAARESVKSVGSVSAKRPTPTPSFHSSFHRDSMIPEWHSMYSSHEEEFSQESFHPLRPKSSAASMISDSPTLGV